MKMSQSKELNVNGSLIATATDNGTCYGHITRINSKKVF
jgi:hypothetical protein